MFYSKILSLLSDWCLTLDYTAARWFFLPVNFTNLPRAVEKKDTLLPCLVYLQLFCLIQRRNACAAIAEQKAKTKLSHVHGCFPTTSFIFLLSLIQEEQQMFPGEIFEVFREVFLSWQHELFCSEKQPFLIKHGIQMQGGQTERCSKWLSSGAHVGTHRLSPPLSLQLFTCTHTGRDTQRTHKTNLGLRSMWQCAYV